MSYDSEAALIAVFVDALRRVNQSPFHVATVSREFDFRSGRTDVVIVNWDGDVLAFEAKLSRWREALHQAYRNTCFAHRSYVVLPWAIAQRAAIYQAEFEARGVGLCAVHDGSLVTVLEAPRHEPVQPWLAERAIEHANVQDREYRWLVATSSNQ